MSRKGLGSHSQRYRRYSRCKSVIDYAASAWMWAKVGGYGCACLEIRYLREVKA